MTAKQFYDWQTASGADDVMRLIDCLERADIQWCAIDGMAVNHWANEAMVTQDVDFVVDSDSVEKSITALESAGFKSTRHEWPVNFKGRSRVSIQLSTEDFYKDFCSRAVPADVHGILLRVASLLDTLAVEPDAQDRYTLDPPRMRSEVGVVEGGDHAAGRGDCVEGGVIGFVDLHV